MFYALSKVLDLAFTPLAWVLVLLGYALWKLRARERAARRALWAALGVLVVFSLEPVANALTWALENPPIRTYHDDVEYDAALLLGGMVDDRATATYGTRNYGDNIERLLTTFDLLRTGKARFTVISGGRVDDTRTAVEAEVLADQLVEWGIDRGRIVIDDQAMNTRENAVNTARIARERGWSRLVVVTSAFHMPRALGCFHEVGLDVDALPVDFHAFDAKKFSVTWQPRAGFFSQSTGAIRELMGRAVYRVRGYSR